MFKLFNRNINIKMRKDKSIYDDWATTKNAEGFFSLIDRLPNPDIVLRKTGKGIGVLRNLTNHCQVGTCIDSRKAGTKSCDYELVQGNTSKNHYDFYDEIFRFLDIDKLIDDILDAPLYGYNPIEINWKKSGSYIVPVKITAKPQEWFYFNRDGEFFFKDKTNGGKRLIDLNSYKFLLPRNKADFLNPYGQAILSRCFWYVAFENGGWEFWVKFTEKFGMPFMFGKYDRSMTKDEQMDLLQTLVNMVQNACGVIPSDGSVEVVPTGTTGNSDIYEKLIDKCENNISKAILGQTLTTDVGNVGSYAAGQVHACVRADIINSDKKLVEKTINQFIKMVNTINFNDDKIPEFKFVEQDLGLGKAERDGKVHALGFDFSEEYITRTYKYQKGDIKKSDRSFDYSNFEEQTTSSMTEFSDTMVLNNLDEVINSNIKTIIDFFNKTRDAEETLEKLAELYPDFNTVKLEETLTKVIFIASLVGGDSVND